MEHKLVHFAADKTISNILKYIDKEPQKNLLKILGIVEKTFKMYPKENYAKMRNAVLDDSNAHTILAKSIFSDFNPMAFVDNLKYMLSGMIAIFIVIGIIVLITVILNKIFSKK